MQSVRALTGEETLQVKDIIVEELGVEKDKLNNEASFMDDLGADSLDTVELVMAFEKEFELAYSQVEAAKVMESRKALEKWLNKYEVRSGFAIKDVFDGGLWP